MTLHEQYKQLIKNIAEVRGIPTTGVSLHDEGVSFTNSQLLSWEMLDTPIDWYTKAVKYVKDRYSINGFPVKYIDKGSTIELEYVLNRLVYIDKKRDLL